MRRKYRIFLSSTSFPFSVFSKEVNISVLDKISGIEFSGGYGYVEENEVEKFLDGFCKNSSILIHNYFPVQKESFILNFCSSNIEIIEKSLNLTMKTVCLCERYNVPYYSFHPGYLSDGEEQADGHFLFDKENGVSYDRALDNFFVNFDVLYKFAESRNVGLLIENLFLRPGGVRTSINCSFDEIDFIISSLPDDVGLLIDLGHLNIVSYYLNINRDEFIDKLFIKYEDKIREIHLSGNDGTFDHHLPLVENDWQLSVLNRYILNKEINITLESRNLDDDILLSNINLIENAIYK